MADKKQNRSKTDADINLDDLEDLGDLGEDTLFADELSVDDDNREPSRSKVVTELAKEAGESALESIIRNTAKKALPEDYSSNYNEAMDLADFTSEVITKNKLALNKSTYRLGKEVSKILPFKIGMLERYLENQQSDFEAYKTQTEEQMRDASVASETASIFDKQLDVQKSLYARTEARQEIEQKERLTQSKVSNEVLANIDGNIAHQTAFTTQISKEYYRRSLELQFKSYYVQADTLKTMREHYRAFAIQFTNIEKNTGLPEFVKLRSTEALQETMREQAVTSIYSSLIGNSKFLEKMKKKMSGFVQDKVESVTSAMDGVTDMLDMVNSSGDGTSSMGMIAKIMAALGGETLGEKIASKISPKLKEKIKDNKLINTGANYMGTLGASASSALESAKGILAEKEQNAQDSGSWLGKTVFGGLRSFLDAGTPGGEDLNVKRAGYLTHNQAAIFDNNVHRSITEVIPMYLARILQTNSDLNAMYSKINGGVQGGSDLLSYDYESRSLDTSANISKNIADKVFKEKAVSQRAKGLGKTILSETISVASKSGMGKIELDSLKREVGSKQSEKKLTDYIDKASKITDGDMDYNKLFKNYEQNEELKKLVESDKELKRLIDRMKEFAPKDIKMTDQRLRDVTRNYPIEPLKNLIRNISILANSQQPHEVSDKDATAISRGFVNYVTKTGQDVIPKSVVDRSGFKFILAKDFNESLQQTIAIFSYDVRKLLEQGSMQLTSSVELMFAVMNKGLRDETDISTKAFQTLADLYPQLVGTGSLDASNTREGVLKIDNSSDKYVQSTKLLESGSTKPLEIKRQRKEKATDGLIANLEKFASNRRKDAKELIEFAKANKSDPSAIANKLVDTLKTYKTSATEQIKKSTAGVKDSISTLIGNQENLLKNFEKTAVNKLIASYDATIEHLESLVKSMQLDEAERISEIDQTQADISSLINSTAHQKEIGMLTKTYRRSNQEGVKLLKSTIETIKSQREAMVEIANDDSSVLKEKVTKMKVTISEGLQSVQASIARYEQIGKEAFNT